MYSGCIRAHVLAVFQTVTRVALTDEQVSMLVKSQYVTVSVLHLTVKTARTFVASLSTSKNGEIGKTAQSAVCKGFVEFSINENDLLCGIEFVRSAVCSGSP
jgi:hypothetical protein